MQVLQLEETSYSGYPTYGSIGRHVWWSFVFAVSSWATQLIWLFALSKIPAFHMFFAALPTGLPVLVGLAVLFAPTLISLTVAVRLSFILAAALLVILPLPIFPELTLLFPGF